ncbi:hypothetical protein V1387_04890 [Allomuricauda taeanensis]|uniref:hypothetical protein n=1 Tax=Flagellimonas taeanensis TaxID=1005926 RepID=UPI002E7BC991|nr:hypothetical protein [Allomuricauda taeanensis]MEE1962012.1 hypothetical protein [Allomuricauda taeanensis]
MKQITITLVISFFCSPIFCQQIPLSEFKLSNSTAPVFILLEETPTEVYVPENLKSLTIHALNNFNESISIELNPYYFIDTKNKGRTFYKYLGIEEEKGKYKQHPFTGITRATSVSFSYLNKEFENIGNENRKVFSLGLRTKLFRIYNPNKVKSNYDSISKVLNKIAPIPQNILTELIGKDDDEQQRILGDYYKSEEGKEHLNSEKVKEHYGYDEAIKKLQSGGVYKTIKPIFQIDGAIAYGILFEENNINSATLNRFGAWLTPELSLPINSEKKGSKTNNYINVFAVIRYVEDGFTSNSDNLFYRDFGGKIEFEVGKFNFGYEYIKRNGSTESERSVGNIKFLINKDVSLTGGFGKDFSSDENLVTLFGINWGLNFGNN